MLFAFVGCSGVGKNTIIGDLLNEHPDEFDILQTLTTRKMREKETQGNPYYFVSMEEFEQLMKDGVIYEHEWIHEQLYGGSWHVLNEKKQSGKTLLKDIDILGANKLKKTLKKEMEVISLFLYVEDVEILLDRLRGRGESEEEIEKRRRRFQLEMSLSTTADYMINNVSREEAGRVINEIIRLEREEGYIKPSADCELPDIGEVQRLCEEAKLGASLACVEIGFNGREMLITDGADRYAAAKKSGTFVQKRIRKLYDESLMPAAYDKEWKNLIK